MVYTNAETSTSHFNGIDNVAGTYECRSINLLAFDTTTAKDWIEYVGPVSQFQILSI